MEKVPFESQNEVRIVTDHFSVGDRVRIPATLTGDIAKTARVIQTTKDLVVVQYEKSGWKESFLRVQMTNVLTLKKAKE